MDHHQDIINIPIYCKLAEECQKHILSVASSKALPNQFSSNERSAAVLIPFCNVNGTPGILLEVRGKLRAHSGEVRYAFLYILSVAPKVNTGDIL